MNPNDDYVHHSHGQMLSVPSSHITPLYYVGTQPSLPPSHEMRYATQPSLSSNGAPPHETNPLVAMNSATNYDYFWKGGTLQRATTGFASTLRRTFSRSSRYVNDTLKKKNLMQFTRPKLIFILFQTMVCQIYAIHKLITKWTIIGVGSLVYCILSYANAHYYARLVKILEPSLLAVTMVTSSFMTIGGVAGYIGALTHRKPLVVLSICLIVPVLGGLIFVGYDAHRVHVSDYLTNTENSAWLGFSSEVQIYLENQVLFTLAVLVSHYPSSRVVGH